MPEIKWIKIKTDIFDDEKIKIIDRMPARDEIIVIWFKLLSLAGKVNQNGLLFISNKIAYTVEMLSAIFNREETSIRMALGIFEKFEMISVEENELISIKNWDKHQNVEGLEKIREQTRRRVAEHRDKQQKFLEECNVTVTDCNATHNVTVTQSNALDIDKEEDIDIKNIYTRERGEIPYQEIVDNFNYICKSLPQIKVLTDSRKKQIKSIYSFMKNDIDKIKKLFSAVEDSDFLTGRSQNSNGWKGATFDWIIKKSNLVKILEGNYLNKTHETINNKSLSAKPNFTGRSYDTSELAKKLIAKGKGNLDFINAAASVKTEQYRAGPDKAINEIGEG